jgi:hypothetical protein
LNHNDMVMEYLAAPEETLSALIGDNADGELRESARLLRSDAVIVSQVADQVLALYPAGSEAAAVVLAAGLSRQLQQALETDGVATEVIHSCIAVTSGRVIAANDDANHIGLPIDVAARLVSGGYGPAIFVDYDVYRAIEGCRGILRGLDCQVLEPRDTRIFDGLGRIDRIALISPNGDDSFVTAAERREIMTRRILAIFGPLNGLYRALVEAHVCSAGKIGRSVFTFSVKQRIQEALVAIRAIEPFVTPPGLGDDSRAFVEYAELTELMGESCVSGIRDLIAETSDLEGRLMAAAPSSEAPSVSQRATHLIEELMPRVKSLIDRDSTATQRRLRTAN